MRICFIGKQPPIQGGVSARGALLADSLAGLGHRVFVVTNAMDVESQYRIEWPTVAVEPTSVLSLTGPVERRVVHPPGPMTRHIPDSSAAVTRLAATAYQTVVREQCDVIFSNYLEPYAVAAHMVSQSTGVPHVVRTAGSDRFRLMKNPELASVYKQVMLSSSCIVGGHPSLEGLGVPRDRMAEGIPPIVPGHFFHQRRRPLDLQQYVRRSQEHGSQNIGSAEFDPSRPTIGYYGKAGRHKGIYETFRSLAELRGRGMTLNFVALVGSGDEILLRQEAVKLGLGDQVWLLPFLPFPLIASFIRACSAIILLEQDFPVRQHTPMKLRECLATGTNVVVSRELLEKDPLAGELRASDLVSEVNDTQQQDQLTKSLEEAVVAASRKPGECLTGLSLGESATKWARRYSDVFVKVVHEDAGDPNPVNKIATFNRLVPESQDLLEGKVSEAFHEFAKVENIAIPTPLVAWKFSRFLGKEWAKSNMAHVPRWLWRYIEVVTWNRFDIEHHLGIPYYPYTSNVPLTRHKSKIQSTEAIIRSNYIRLLYHPIDDERSEVARYVEGKPSLRGALESVLASDNEEGGALLLHKWPDLTTRSFNVGAHVAQILEDANGLNSMEELSHRVPAGRGVFESIIHRLRRDSLVRIQSSKLSMPLPDCTI